MTAIVPATDRPPTLARCLEAIAAADDRPEEVLVADDGRPTGAADARNAGAARATGELLVFVDADVLVHADAFTRIRADMSADPQLDAVFGSYDDAPGDPGTVSRFRNLLHHHVHQRAPGATSSFWAGLGCVRASTFRRVGGFEPGRRWLEDVELGHRIASRDGHIRLDPGLLGTHLKRWRLGEMIVTDVWRRGRPWVELLLARRAHPGELNLAWRHRASVLAAVLVPIAAMTSGLVAAAVAAGAFVVLNAGFYRLLLARGGLLLLVAAVPLHALHLLAGLAGVPFGIVTHLLRRRWRRPGPAPVRTRGSA